METPPPAKPGKIVFAKLTPKLLVQLNDRQIFEEQIPGFSNVGSNYGWRPDTKKMIVLDSTTPHKEFTTFFFTETNDGPIYGGIDMPGKNFRIKFRLSANNLADGEQANGN